MPSISVFFNDPDLSRHRSMFLATTGLVWAISAGVGPLLGGLFSQYLTWRWAFWINLPCAVVAFVVLFLMMGPLHPRSRQNDQQKSMDWIGSVSIIGVTVMVLLSLDFGGVVSPWDSPKVLGLLLGGLTLLVFFLLWEGKGSSNPLIPFRLLDRPSKIGHLMVCFTHGFVRARLRSIDGGV